MTNNELTTVNSNLPSNNLTPTQIELIKNTIAKGASNDELALFVNQCNKTGLDPFARQIYSIKRRNWDKETQSYKETMTTQVSIDGFRLIAERSGEYEGQTEPEWCGLDGIWKKVWLDPKFPSAAKVGVYRKSFKEPLMAVALFTSYCPMDKNNNPTGLWSKMPEVMLLKVAEAQALRKAFPQELSGLYTTEEMAQVDNEPVKAQATVISEPKKILSQTDQQRITIFKMLKELGENPKDATEACDIVYFITGIELKEENFTDIISELEKKLPKIKNNLASNKIIEPADVEPIYEPISEDGAETVDNTNKPPKVEPEPFGGATQAFKPASDKQLGLLKSLYAGKYGLSDQMTDEEFWTKTCELMNMLITGADFSTYQASQLINSLLKN